MGASMKPDRMQEITGAGPASHLGGVEIRASCIIYGQIFLLLC